MEQGVIEGLLARLVPAKFLAGAALAALMLGGALVNRQCAVTDLDEQLRNEIRSGNRARDELAQVRETKAKFALANEQMAEALRRARARVEALEAAGRARQAQADAALRAAQRDADEQRAAAQWLTGLLTRKGEVVKPGECEAAAAVRVVREALK